MVFHQRDSCDFLSFLDLKKIWKNSEVLVTVLSLPLIKDVTAKRLNVLAVKMNMSDKVMEKWEFIW